jgi:hypothetical protein
MKTTVEISESLLAEAKSLARERRSTLRQVIEEGLRIVIEKEHVPRKRFKLRDGSFRGEGMVKDFTWPELRALIYEGRGGEE